MVGLGPAILEDFNLSYQEPGVRIRSFLPWLHNNNNNKNDHLRYRKRNDNTSRWVAVTLQDGIQLSMALYLALLWHETWAAAVLTALVVPQIFTQRSLLFARLVDPQKAFEFGHPFILAGMVTTAVALGHAAGATSGLA